MLLALVAIYLLNEQGAASGVVDRSVVHFRAPINKDTVDQVLGLIGPETRTFVVMSQGGDMREAIRLSEVIKSLKIQVRIERYCLSACANYIIAASSEPVIIPADAIVGFHTSLRTMNSTTSMVSPSDAARLYGPYVVAESRFLRSAKINPDFFDLAIRKIEPVCVGISAAADQRPTVTFLASKLDFYMPSVETLQSYGFRVVGDVPLNPLQVAQRARAAIGTARNNLRWADDSRQAATMPASLPRCTPGQLAGGLERAGLPPKP